MTKILGGKIAKFATLLIAALLVLTASLAFVGCETKRPEISMKITFNGETYELEYVLYRNMYPQTVAHYLELIDMGYYDGTVIHDYQSSRMVGGGYYYESADADIEDDLLEKDYDAATKDENGNVTLDNVSVWADADKAEAYNTLYGEFSKNGFTVENNGLTNQLGALGTYYYTPVWTDSDAPRVYVQLNSSSEMDTRYYCYNSTRSLFYMYTGSSGTETQYCTFGLLKDSGDEETFQNLLDAIEEYTLETLNGGDEEGTEVFTTEVPRTIEDEYWDESSYEDVTFNVPRAKIVIEEVRVLKY